MRGLLDILPRCFLGNVLSQPLVRKLKISTLQIRIVDAEHPPTSYPCFTSLPSCDSDNFRFTLYVP